MAVANMLRRAASAAAPLAVRLAGISLRRTSVVEHGRQQLFRSLFPAATHFSTAAAKDSECRELVRVLEAEIRCADDTDVQDGVADVPGNFPFKIEDNPGEQIVKLTRQYDGETIEVEVYMPDLVTGDDDENDDAGDNSENNQQSTLPLLVKISKGVGPSLEFSCSAYGDEINIDSLSVKDPETSDDMAYAGPDFGDLDENLQKAFHRYLCVRGITPSATNFLHEYMINKDSREYKTWLSNLKKFIEA